MMNEKGAVTLDFIFAFVLVMGLSGILLALTLTLTVASITQYITFASARTYHAAHINHLTQAGLAIRKFEQLKNDTPAFSTFFKENGWFEVEHQITGGFDAPQQILSQFPEYAEENADDLPRTKFMGVYASFTAKVLNFRIPFFGSTSDDERGFSTFIASYLNWEPSSFDCNQFNSSRWQAIRQLDVPSGVSPYSTSTEDNGYFPIGDNGC